ncbi:MAG TPA: type II toxin-antitoxin system VapC family toxin [Thermoguttaceae bacterium]|nr:type II toxin-antitoxin system VapC family toxin [Thermoguttaceae bacterium]
MATVYLETTIVGHVAGRLLPDPFVAVRQQVTRDWWHNHAPDFSVYISQLVLDECSAGDSTAAEERLAVVAGIDLLESSEEVDSLANRLIVGMAIPASEPRDAFHIAISAVNGVEYLLTWNCKHGD